MQINRVLSPSPNPISLITGLILFLSQYGYIAKSNPTAQISPLTAFNRAKTLDNGISVSWYEQTWNQDILTKPPLTTADMLLLKQLGFKSIRLPVAFTYFDSLHIPSEEIFTHIDNFVKQCGLLGFKIVIDYHAGNFNDTTYSAETPKIINLWLKLAKRYSHVSQDQLFFELYNEPPHMNPDLWRSAAVKILAAIRKVDKQRTVIIGASNYNSIYELSRFVPLADKNVIYTFHFYEPFLFTHQGAEWAGDQESTTGIPFPYNKDTWPAINAKAENTDGQKNYDKYPVDGNEQSVMDKLNIVKAWSEKCKVPILCGEYGVYNKYTDQDSRCRYIKTVKQALQTLNIPGMMWEYNSGFSIFTGPPSLDTLPACMRDAIGFTAQK